MDRRERYLDPEEMLRIALDGKQAQIWTALPCIIQSFDPSAMTCEAQPTISMDVRQQDGTTKAVKLPLLLDCPVVFPSGGGFSLTFPIKPGNECLVIFSSRCIDAWHQYGGVQGQAEYRMHDLSDGFCLPEVFSRPRVLPNISTNATQLRSHDGQTYVEVGPAKISLVADVVEIHGRNKTSFDAGGTGFVYQPGQIDTYTNGVPSTSHAPNPPKVP